jgi:MFS family permease
MEPSDDPFSSAAQPLNLKGQTELSPINGGMKKIDLSQLNGEPD